MRNKSSIKKPPVADYLGLNLKDQGFETFNDAPIEEREMHLSTYEDENDVSLQDLVKPEETLAKISADRCRLWGFSDRLDAEMGDIDSLALSISKHGQQEPILLRPIEKQDGVEFEVIFGNRRWRACSMLGIPVKSIIRSVSDQDAAVAQKEENDNREDISDYTRGFYYKNLLDKKVFSSIRKLSEKMGIGKSTLDDLLSYTRIDKRVLEAMPEPHKLNRASAVKLSQVLSEANIDTIEMLINMAPDIQKGTIPARQIESRLLNKTSTPKKNTTNKVYRDRGGNLFLQVKVTAQKEHCFTIPRKIAELIEMEELESLIVQHLKDKSNVHELSG